MCFVVLFFLETVNKYNENYARDLIELLTVHVFPVACCLLVCFLLYHCHVLPGFIAFISCLADSSAADVENVGVTPFKLQTGESVSGAGFEPTSSLMLCGINYSLKEILCCPVSSLVYQANEG